jgi:cytochrome c oxidase cbb3-type subunit 2
LATVTLAAGLREWLTGFRRGWFIGMGTGLAYLVCNLPGVFDASPRAQTMMAALVCLPGIWAARRARGDTEPAEGATEASPLDAVWFRGLGFAGVVAMFFALVWLDATAFATIQLTEPLRARTWGTPTMRLMLGLVHAGGALAAGWAIDRGWFRRLLFGTFGLFGVAFALLQQPTAAWWLSGPLYAIGISVYSTALVAFPTWRGDGAGLVPARWRAAGLYAVSGWIASGLGVGLAQHLHTIPGWLLALAGGVLGAGLLLPRMAGQMRLAGHAAGLGLIVVVGVAFHTVTPKSSARLGEEPSVAMGRAVYREEGCINCHSQYVRPHAPDVVRWGPYRPIDRTEQPPFVGNRRQGPDLLNAGLRRDAAWHRQHLIDPPSLAPGSRMPSYAHLFRNGDPRGEALVAYLGSLGSSGLMERVEVIRAWAPGMAVADGPAVRAAGRARFARNCAMCHGEGGGGDGPLASVFLRPAMVLSDGPFTYVPPGLDAAGEVEALARIIKFGLPGMSMPGHETWRDEDVLEVAAYVRSLASGKAGP